MGAYLRLVEKENMEMAKSRSNTAYSVTELLPRVAGASALGAATRGNPLDGKDFGGAPRVAGTFEGGTATRGSRENDFFVAGSRDSRLDFCFYYLTYLLIVIYILLLRFYYLVSYFINLFYFIIIFLFFNQY